MDSIFAKLNAVNVADKVEQKNGLTYLSWAFAWGELKKVCPDASYKVYEAEGGCIYWNDGKTAWVKVGVTIGTLEHIEYLPVMDNRNQSIAVDKITSTDANKTIQRGLTKAIARHGLGLYIYAGEDLPEGEKKTIPVSTLGIKEPQRKSASEPTAEQLKEIAALKAKEYHKDEPVKEEAKVEPSASQTPSDDLKSATGTIVGRKPANKWGYVVVCLEGFQKEDGKDIPFTTKNPELVKVLDSIPDGHKVHLEYKVVVNAKGYTNYYIENALEVVPF
jgi:hypothetical protein